VAHIDDLLTNILSVLRGVADLRAVSLAGEPTSRHVPRASVALLSRETFPPDDSATGVWHRTTLRIVIVNNAGRTDAGLARLSKLAETVVQALLCDPHRGGICSDLPIGRATEIECFETFGVDEPGRVAVTLIIRTHSESEVA
jgi:hypothetical protein